MSEMEKLAAQMKQQRDQKTSSDNALNALTLELDKRIEQWTESVGKVFDEIEIWLDPLAQNDLVKFKRDRVKIEEKLPQNLVAKYEAPVLAMSINEKAARIETVGLFLTDCDGALDFMAREKQYRITRHVGNDVQWMIQAKYGSLRKGVILSQDSFAEAIRHYL
ncbi:hypothetical protein C7425_104253 [Pantoea ananatis]|uniref:hypothetical protein n=1 Tax=Pantoea ananas TaxID=553 RepID=UPI000D6AB86F|nr:hypothetical protein [Pantoea ananatis]PWK09871.1 hypothetical protein C7421_103186 [Pantoea ananatis]PWV66527.1 hypothetical protein C7425_104253 [Pantoea ananatis]